MEEAECRQHYIRLQHVLDTSPTIASIKVPITCERFPEEGSTT